MTELPTESDPARIVCGDCRDLLPSLPRGDIAVITDPPFGIGYSTGHGGVAWGDGSVAGDEDTAVRDWVLEWAVGRGMSVLCFGSWRALRPAGTRALVVWDTLGANGMGDLRIPWKPSHQEIYVLGDPHGFCGPRDNDVIQNPPYSRWRRTDVFTRWKSP